MKSTNYQNAFIAIAGSCKKTQGTIPATKTPPTNAQMQWEMIFKNPYKYTSDEVLFAIHNKRNQPISLQKFFGEKHQPCFRCSPLTKNYGWGIHCNKEGKMALFGAESAEYKAFSKDQSLKQYHAFSSKK